MPYYKASSEFLIKDVGATTQNGSGHPYNLEAYLEAVLFVNVESIDTGALQLVVETSPDNTTWYTHTTITPSISTAGRTAHKITGFGKHLRVSWTLTGGANANFRLSFVGKG